MEKLFSSFRRSAAVFALVGMIAATTGALASGYDRVRTGDTTVSLSDGKDHVAAGGSLLYVIKVTQNSGPLRYTDVFMTLPSYANTVYPDGGGRVVGSRVIWDRLSLAQGEEKIFSVQVNIGQNAPLNTVLTASVQADRAVASDTTTVRSGKNLQSYRISVTDNRDLVYPGQALQYVVTVRNTSGSDAQTDVTADVSALSTVQSISPSASLVYPTITWKDVHFEAGEQKTFTFQAAMKKRVAPYTSARVIVHAGRQTATDTTVSRSLHGDPVFMTSTQLNNPSSHGGRIASSASNEKPVLFRKNADSANVLPGGTIRYTFLVRNVLLNSLRDAVITDRFDPTQIEIIDAGAGTIVSPGVIQWRVPVLQSGKSWQTSYTVRVAKNLKSGTAINSVATISGTDLNRMTLSEKVTVAQTAVVGNMPATGGAFDLLFMLASAPLAFTGMKLQRKLSC